MAKRYWKVGCGYGYAGTNSEEVIDVCRYLGYDEDIVEDLDPDFVREQLCDAKWEEAIERVNVWANPEE